MKNKNATDWIVNYIEEQNMLVKQMSIDLKISESKLRGEQGAEFTAEEFLSLCSYLNITPEKIQKEIR